MKCTRCEQYPCRCTGSRDVIAEYYAGLPAPDPERPCVECGRPASEHRLPIACERTR